MQPVNHLGNTTSERGAIMPDPGAADGEQAKTAPCVLVVEDDNTLRLILSRELRRRGFEVYATGSGAEAVEMYCRSLRSVDLVLMDVNMPGQTGPETLTILQAADPGVRCCFMTADVQAATHRALTALGALAVFGKPFASLTELCVRLRFYATRPTDMPETSEIKEVMRWIS